MTRTRKAASRAKKMEDKMSLLDRRTFVDRAVYPFHYSSFDNLVQTSGVLQTWVLNANSLFDPDQTNVGHQPIGYDALVGANGTSTAPYGAYMVTHCRVKATFYPLSSNTVPTMIGVVSAPGAKYPGASDTWDTVQETYKSYSKHASIVPAAVEPVTITVTVPIRKLFLADNLYDEDFWGDYNGNPNNLARIVVYAQPIDQNASNSNRVSIKVDFLATLGSLNEMVSS